MAKFVAPSDLNVKDILGMLFGRDLEAAADSTKKGWDPKWHVGVYTSTEDASPMVACAFDTAFAAYAGCALSMIPVGTAKDAIKENDLSDMMIANLREVLNILSRCVLSNTTPHIVFDDIYAGDQLSDATQTLVKDPAEEAHIVVTIPKYGDGKLAFFVT